MGKQEESKNKKNEKIINTAFRIFVEKKIEPVSITEIAEKAGVGRATVFRYYPTKVDLAIAVCSAKWKEAGCKATDRFRQGYSCDRQTDLYTGQLYRYVSES